MQEVVRVHILQKPSQENNRTLKQKGKRVRKAGRRAEGLACCARPGRAHHVLHARSGEALLGCSGHMGWSGNGTLVVPRHERRGRARGHSPPPSPTGLECLPRPLTMPFKRVCFLNNVQEIITPVSNSQPKSILVWPGSLGPGPLPFSLFH